MSQNIIAYGDTLHGKTSFLASVLRYCAATYPKFRARLYTAENWDALTPWVKAGILEVWNIDTRQNPFETVIQAAQGYWPANPLDPTSKVLPPSKKDLEEVKGWFYEGMATFGDYMMGNYATGGLAARSGRKEKVGPSEDTIAFCDGSTLIGGNPRTHYNIVQRWIHGAVVKSRILPGHVIWTSHEVVAKDDRSNKLIIGPEIVGTAATSGATRWFGNVFHVTRVDRKVKDDPLGLASDYRIYLKAHYSAEIPNIPYKAVLRVPPEVQEVADKLIPDFLPNNKDAFSKFIELRNQIDTLSADQIKNISVKA